MIPYPFCAIPGARALNRAIWLLRYGAPWPATARRRVTFALWCGELRTTRRSNPW